jgi:hypothetical protein
LNALTGILLVIGYPTKALTNPVFYAKLLFVALAIGLMIRIRDEVLPKTVSHAPLPSARTRILAGLSLASWVATIIAGRLLPYTYTRLLVDFRGAP